MKTYVVGHKNPDTDSIVSAIAVADLYGFTAARAGELNKETEYLLQKFNFQAPEVLPTEEKRVFIVDTTNPDEIAEGVTDEQIAGVIDHHKLGGLKAQEPVTVTVKPVGSTATVIFGIIKEEGKEISKEIAGLMTGAIVSDTLNLASPTTTDLDRDALGELAAKAETDPGQLAEAMFKAKSDISDIKTEELITKDYKISEMSGRKVGIGVWETVLPELVLERKEEITEALKKRKEADGLDAILFAAVDILKGNSEMFVISEAEASAVSGTFGVPAKEGIIELTGIVSRKKQMVPPLEKYFSNL
jgi:manganese-dependent inorganic pyrophosphatase